MLQTAFTLTLTQFARSLSLPERLQHAPARNLALEALRLRNTTLDALFYDVKVISPDEVFYISDSLAAEGSIMIVPPSGAGSLTFCETLEEFVLRGGEDVHGLAVAGVGGSALGAAAFARNVADAIGQPVAVVVSGYGLADIVNEVFGGGFFFGHLKGLRPVFERLDDLAGRTRFGIADIGDQGSPSSNSLDTRCVRALLSDPRLSFRLLAGHSKGNLVIAAALHDIAKQDPESAARLADGMRIVTFGARIAMPPAFGNVSDVIGEWDWFGEMNSRSYISADARVRHAWHHTNTDLAGHLPVTETLRELLADNAPPPREKAAESVAPAVTAAPEPTNVKAEAAPATTPAAKVASVAAPEPPEAKAKEPERVTPAVTTAPEPPTAKAEAAPKPAAKVASVATAIPEAPKPKAEAAEPVAPAVSIAPKPPTAKAEAAPTPIPAVKVSQVAAPAPEVPKTKAEKPAVRVAPALTVAPEPPKAKAAAPAPTPAEPSAEPSAAITEVPPAPPKPVRKSRSAKAERSDVTESVLSKVSALRAARKGRPGPTKRH
ncbi:cell envelope biogenesis protein OmpA [Rhizobium sp. RAF56]|uniref:cell envelope biogenesis protein OmpA n=1 Tax=Rhizobium sp. RAF56 TaxID=3233062 RepID=UPI003F9CCAF2